jgi:hypothetical protein
MKTLGQFSAKLNNANAILTRKAEKEHRRLSRLNQHPEL